MIGALIAGARAIGAKKAAGEGVEVAAKKVAGEGAEVAAKKAGSTLKKKIGSIASKAINAAGLAALMGGDGGDEAQESPRAAAAPSSKEESGGAPASKASKSDPLISLAGLGSAITAIVPNLEDTLAPIKRESSKTAVIIRKDVPVIDDTIRAGTYIETRIEQIATLFQVVDSLRQDIGLLDAKLSGVHGGLEKIDDSIEEATDQNRSTILSNERRRDEEQSENRSVLGKGREILGQGVNIVKAGILATLVKYSKALVAGAVLTALTAFGEETEASTDDEEFDIEVDTNDVTVGDVALGTTAVAATGATAAAMTRRARQKAAAKLAAEGAEAAIKTTGKTVATEGAEAIAKGAGKAGAAAAGEVAVKETIEKAVPKIAAKEISKTAGKSIPVLGWVVGGGLAVYQLARGNPAGAAVDLASSLAGPLTGIPLMVASIADEVYHAVYGTFAGNDLVSLGADIVGNRMNEIEESVSQYVAEYFANNAEYPEDEEALKSAMAKGIYDLDYLGDSEVDLSRLSELTEREIKAIIAEDDIDAETKETLLARLNELSASEEQRMINGFKVGTVDRPSELRGAEIPGVGDSAETPRPETAITETSGPMNNTDIIDSQSLMKQIIDVSRSVSEDTVNSVIPIIMRTPSVKPASISHFVAGSSFPSSSESSQPSFMTRDPFVAMEFQT